MYGFPKAPPGLFMDDGNKPVAHGYGINWEDPLSEGLTSLIPFWEAAGSGALGLVSGVVGTITTATWQATELGPALRFNESNPDYLLIPNYQLLTPYAITRKATVSVLVRFTASGYIYYQDNGGSLTHRLIVTGGGELQVLTFHTGNGIFLVATSTGGGASPDGNFHTVTWIMDADVPYLQLYVDGILRGEDLVSAGSLRTSTNAGLGFGSLADGSFPWSGDISRYTALDRVWSLDEIQEDAANPFRLITPVSSTPFVSEAPPVGNRRRRMMLFGAGA